MKGTTALVTGAAGGIGAAVARALAREGAAVALVDRAREGVDRLAADLAADGHDVLALAADVRRDAEARSAVAAVEDRLGPLDHLVNAAGVLRLGPAWELSDDQWAESLGVNATGVFTMSRAAAARMVPRGRGAIVTVTSNAAGTARKGMAAYAASKAASEMFTKCLGLELAEHGIRCNTVAPGSTDTPMLHSMWAGSADRARTLDGDPAAYRVGIPLRRLAAPEDVAAAVAFLLSDSARHITMHTLTVDGGATLGV
ncbi:2,3-dihydro-2,3-dihydroxybenzoate dehydrogenase [Streptomonospora sp. S1-112]|uniref:2,3-dihydro-2,3-dihydroxybenzoate dehydrogenase n=1 Tax=Streptomonospora mangrovi TaxID=2883123 RepID=A0A9X3NIA7_9ACTN|nr:2,3-dihydro-2,3-dihydroxybenzoate dehydrogenase [Streptomonospora mangrovi]MDA0563942.1 2,3-dihydro-2,3-dihydroxybenzoate dehydrogenase [Streptomonospora mangrovi]